MYFGANQDSFSEAHKFGFQNTTGRALNWKADKDGTQYMADAFSNSIRNISKMSKSKYDDYRTNGDSTVWYKPTEDADANLNAAQTTKQRTNNGLLKS